MPVTRRTRTGSATAPSLCRSETTIGRGRKPPSPDATLTAVKRYFVTTFGCQMNAHDSERIKGLLEDLGLGEAPSREEADVLVFNTCTIREKPDTKFAAYMGDAAAQKRAKGDTVIAVG